MNILRDIIEVEAVMKYFVLKSNLTDSDDHKILQS